MGTGCSSYSMDANRTPAAPLRSPGRSCPRGSGAPEVVMTVVRLSGVSFALSVQNGNPILKGYFTTPSDRCVMRQREAIIPPASPWGLRERQSMWRHCWEKSLEREETSVEKQAGWRGAGKYGWYSKTDLFITDPRLLHSLWKGCYTHLQSNKINYCACIYYGYHFLFKHTCGRARETTALSARSLFTFLNIFEINIMRIL